MMIGVAEIVAAAKLTRGTVVGGAEACVRNASEGFVVNGSIGGSGADEVSGGEEEHCDEEGVKLHDRGWCGKWDLNWKASCCW